MKLQLSLKHQWFEMTKVGIKKEDYREITPYWVSRFFMGKLSDEWNENEFCNFLKTSNDANGYLRLWGKKFITHTMTLGYPSKKDTERIIHFEHAGIEIRTGNHEWGAEPNKLYFVIKHGKRL